MTLETERHKYARMWAVPDYRLYSPGLQHARQAYYFFQPEPGDTLLDLGCGTGRASAYFATRGLGVTLVDFVPAAVEVEGLPFVEACLWELPDTLQADFTYCVDVLEHIPPEHVADVLRGIRRATRKKAFVQIATRPDKFGAIIKETLHLSLHDANWWQAKFAAYFSDVQCEADPDQCRLSCTIQL
jgi:SAM-dependent methyltransferase